MVKDSSREPIDLDDQKAPVTGRRNRAQAEAADQPVCLALEEKNQVVHEAPPLHCTRPLARLASLNRQSPT